MPPCGQDCLIGWFKMIWIHAPPAPRSESYLPSGDLNYRFCSDEQAMLWMIDNLRIAIDGVLINQLRVNGTMFAIELEPGAIFSIRDWNTIRTFRCLLDQDQMLSPLIGLNLDIAHFILAGIQPEQLLEDTSVFSRICHAHIANVHSSGHFADMPLQTTDVLPLTKWRDVISCLQHCRSSPGIPFSGYVSVKIKATNNPRVISSSIEAARMFLRMP